MPTKPTRNRPLAAYGRNRGTQEWPVVSIATRPLVKRRKASPTDLTRLWVRGAMPCLVIQPVYQRIASIVTGATKDPPARRPSTQSTSPPPAHTERIQEDEPRSTKAPHRPTVPSP